ncbi:MAG: M23 family metallopeptidase [Polynucleobacter sp.]
MSAELDRLRSDLAQAQAAAREAERIENESLAGIQSQNAAYERQLAQARAESEAIKQQLGAGSGGSRPGSLVWPLRGPVTSPFGPRPHPIFGVVRYHDGIDFGVASGTPIKAAASGTVIFAGWRGGYGNATIIDHGGGMATLYGHQSAFAASAGQQVRAGQVIGYVGSTGNSTGPHLHFEVRINGAPVNPMNYL